MPGKNNVSVQTLTQFRECLKQRAGTRKPYRSQRSRDRSPDKGCVDDVKSKMLKESKKHAILVSRQRKRRGVALFE
tara:strand:+ start:79 stop:306 length:228 start_codon:yes stop_codon:yes gene_type:complete